LEFNVLDYGSLGLLALALVGIGAFLRNYLTKQQESQAEREKLDRQDRKDLTASFQDLIHADVEAKHQLASTLENLCAEVKAGTGSQGQVVEALAKLVERLDRNEKRAEQRHQQATRQSEERHAEILAQCKMLNGKN